MLIIKKINIYYFSGTGNTKQAVKAMEKEFAANGIQVNLFRIEKTDPRTVDVSGLLGLAFPVAVQSTYPLVWSFIKALPAGKGCPVFAVDTLGGFSGGVMAPLKALLKQKGYRPFAAVEIQMPPNIFYIMSDAENRRLLDLGINKAVKFAQAILSGQGFWLALPVLPYLMYCLSMGLLKLSAFKWHQKFFRYKVKKELCTRCGLCIKDCPVKNITAEDNGYPVWALHCQYCMRCVSYCPAKAIPAVFNYKKKVYAPPSI